MNWLKAVDGKSSQKWSKSQDHEPDYCPKVKVVKNGRNPKVTDTNEPEPTFYNYYNYSGLL